MQNGSGSLPKSHKCHRGGIPANRNGCIASTEKVLSGFVAREWIPEGELIMAVIDTWDAVVLGRGEAVSGPQM
jgi:hypothetical protein